MFTLGRFSLEKHFSSLDFDCPFLEIKLGPKSVSVSPSLNRNNENHIFKIAKLEMPRLPLGGGRSR